MKVLGAVAFRDIAAGAWTLRGDDGRTYELAGGDARLMKEGQRVEVEGELDAVSVSTAMVGPLLKVKRYRLL